MDKWEVFVLFIILSQIPLVVADFAFTFSLNITNCSNKDRNIYLVPTKHQYEIKPMCLNGSQPFMIKNCSSDCPFFSTRCFYIQAKTVVNNTGCTIETTKKNEYETLLLIYEEIHRPIASTDPFKILKSYGLINGSLPTFSDTVDFLSGGLLSFSIEANQECSQNFCGQNCNEKIKNGCFCTANRETFCPNISPRVSRITLLTTTTDTYSTMTTKKTTEGSVNSSIKQTTVIAKTMSEANSTPSSIDSDLVIGLSISLAIAIIAFIALVVFLCKLYRQRITNSCRPIDDEKTDDKKLIADTSILTNNSFNGSERSFYSDNKNKEICEESRRRNATDETISSNGSIKKIISDNTNYASHLVSTFKQKTKNMDNDSTCNSTTYQSSNKTSKSKIEENTLPSSSKNEHTPKRQNLDDEKDEESKHSLNNVTLEKEPYGLLQDKDSATLLDLIETRTSEMDHQARLCIMSKQPHNMIYQAIAHVLRMQRKKQ